MTVEKPKELWNRGVRAAPGAITRDLGIHRTR